MTLRRLLVRGTAIAVIGVAGLANAKPARAAARFACGTWCTDTCSAQNNNALCQGCYQGTCYAGSGCTDIYGDDWPNTLVCSNAS